MSLEQEAICLVSDMVVNVAKCIAPMVEHVGTPTGDVLAAMGQDIFAKALDLAIAARGCPPHDAFKLLSRWGVCVPTNQDGVDATIVDVANGIPSPRPCTVIHEHGQYNLVHCRRGANGGIFCLVDTETDEGIAEDVMHRMVDALIEDLESTPST